MKKALSLTNYGQYGKTSSYTNSHTTYNTSYIHIFVDENNICYAVKTNHNSKYRTFSPGKTIGLILGTAGFVTFVALGASGALAFIE